MGSIFLGTGASKLTSSAEFDSAIRRCNRPERPMRFLLLDPKSPVLKTTALSDGQRDSQYQERVRTSLSKLALLVKRDKMNIQVRLYSSPSSLDVFRCMFINDNVCLLSYNASGRNEGRNLPQIIITDFDETDNRSSFFYPMKQHFERRWEQADDWNPDTYM